MKHMNTLTLTHLTLVDDSHDRGSWALLATVDSGCWAQIQADLLRTSASRRILPSRAATTD